MTNFDWYLREYMDANKIMFLAVCDLEIGINIKQVVRPVIGI
jgi:hypothetical protein